MPPAMSSRDFSRASLHPSRAPRLRHCWLRFLGARFFCLVNPTTAGVVRVIPRCVAFEPLCYFLGHSTDRASQCRVSAFQYVTDSSNLRLYSQGFWDFPNSQTYGTVYRNNTNISTFGISVRTITDMIYELGTAGKANLTISASANSPALAAYFR